MEKAILIIGILVVAGITGMFFYFKNRNKPYKPSNNKGGGDNSGIHYQQ